MLKTPKLPVPAAVFTLAVALVLHQANPTRAQRVLGVDVSAWQGNISTTEWSTLKNTNGRDFVFIRSSRGGTTGFYNQNDASNSQGLNTLSQRYDDPYFVQNITRATAAGLYAGAYHFSRPDIIASTLNSGGIANTGTDEANHFLQMAGAWMRPGYLLPVFDLEVGQSQRSAAQLAQFSVDFSNRIYDQTGVRPVMYINGSYASYLEGTGVEDAFPVLWTARYANQSNPDAIPVQTGHPKDTFSAIYGPWDNPPAPTHPWSFWQYASTATLSGYRNGTAAIDTNVAQGGIEFLKDHLVPALWVTNSSGDWSSLANWNSGQTPVAPVQGPGQVARVGALTLPAVRLPSVDDTVILERSAADPTITISSGAHTIRKLVAREALAISGGSLTLNYVPSSDSTPYSARIEAPLLLVGTGALSAHTIEVAPREMIAAAGGTLTFQNLRLGRDATTPARVTLSGNLSIAPLTGATATISSTGSGAAATIDLNGGERTLAVADGAAAVDLSVETPLVSTGVGVGALVKDGPGTLRLAAAGAYTGATTVRAGKLLASVVGSSATGSGPVSVEAAGVLGGVGDVAGTVSVEGAISPGESGALAVGRLSVGGADFHAGSRLEVEIGGPVAFDKLVVSGALVIDSDARIQASLVGGFVPAMGDRFTVVQALGGATRDGLFGGIVDAGAVRLSVVADAQGVALVVSTGLAGDYNNDGVVNAADYTVWRDAVGQSAGSLLNDPTGLAVGQAQLAAWSDNFGASLAAPAAAVPEPATLAVGLASLVLFPRRR